MRIERIKNIIKSQFPEPKVFEIEDQSHQHAGRQGQESHFKILLVSDLFVGKNRVQRQRLLNNLLKEEFDQGLHAMSMRLLSEEEFNQQSAPFETPDCQNSRSKAD